MYALAIIPGIILFFVIWKFDKVEKEPPRLLIKLFLFGALTVISAVIFAYLGDRILGFVFKNPGSFGYVFIDSFIFTALIQETGKFLVLKKATWKNREFNYTFDAVVYSAAVSLGFALCENLVYLLGSGTGADLRRVLLSVPGHLFYAVFMGYFYGCARYAAGDGDKENTGKHLAEALFVPVLMNGFYMLCLRTERPVFFVVFVLYETFITVITVRRFIALSKQDMIIPGMEWTVLPDDAAWEEDSNEGKM